MKQPAKLLTAAKKVKRARRARRHERHALAVLGAIVLVVAVWYGAIWGPLTSRLHNAQSAEAAAAAQVAEDRAQIAQLRTEAPKVKAEKAILGHLTNLVPYDPALNQLLGYIRQAAAKAGVTLTDVGTPTPAGWPGATAPSNGTTVGASKADQESIDVSLTVLGSQSGMLRLITDLDHEPRLFVVQTATIATTGGGTLTAEAFYGSAKSGNPSYPG